MVHEVLQLSESGKVVSIRSSSTSIFGIAGGAKQNVLSSWYENTLKIFLPAGYPHTVTSDYLEYQIYDSLQAFSSTIAGLLASRAVLEGVGVGNADASPTAAMLLNILQDSFGRIATILFAWRLGTSLQAECKMWRLTADIFNDGAIILSCLSPLLPIPMRIAVLCMNSIFRALCGVAAGGAKAALGIHFASRGGDVSDLSAKENSQETVISLLGMWAGSFVVSHVQSTYATWTCLLLLISIHLETNRRAVRAVAIPTLNRQRTNILLSHYLFHHRFPNSNLPANSSLPQEPGFLSPRDVSLQERIFEKDGVLRWTDGREIGTCEIGVGFSDLADLITGPAKPNTPTGHEYALSDDSLRRTHLSNSIALFADLPYILWCRPISRPSSLHVKICLKTNASTRDSIRAWTHALILAHMFRYDRPTFRTKMFTVASLVQQSFIRLKETRLDFEAMKEAGWDVDTSSLLTRADNRISVVQNTKKEQ